MRHRIAATVATVLVAASCTGGATTTSNTGTSSTPPPSPTTTTSPSTTVGHVPSTTTTAPPPDSSSTTTISPTDTVLRLEPVADGFERPVFFVANGRRAFVVDQPGVVWVVTSGGEPVAFLDIRDRVRFGGEQGLLGLAFDPDGGNRLYVNYTANNGDTVVAEFTFEPGGGVADPESERIILTVDQPAANHNGGMVAFGPEGDLWIGMGDGGASNDAFGNGQRDDTLLGSMLRVAVGPEIETYAIPRELGFAAPEAWAIGLRNPWRFSFDGDVVWIADVGQGDVEEINRESVEDRTLNFGWPIYEGTDCFAGPCTGVDGAGRTISEPIHEYRHDEGCSITGGYVYRGDAIPQLVGHFFFSDWCAGFIRSIAPDGSIHDWTDGTGVVQAVTSFGRDDLGEVYVVSGAGTVYRIVEAQR